MLSSYLEHGKDHHIPFRIWVQFILLLALLQDVFAEIGMNMSADEQNTWSNCAYEVWLLRSARVDSRSQYTFHNQFEISDIL